MATPSPTPSSTPASGPHANPSGQTTRLIRVALPVPGLGPLTYRVPETFEVPPVGARVLVPLGARMLTGCVVPEPAEAQGPGEDPGRPSANGAVSTVSGPVAPGPGNGVKDVVDVLDQEPFLPPGIVDLAQWVAEYYAASPGETLASAMPPGASIESDRRVTATPAGAAWLADATVDARQSTRAQILHIALQEENLSLTTVVGRVRRLGGERATPASIVAAARSLTREGLMVMARPLVGRADAHKSVTVVSLTLPGAATAIADIEAGSATAGEEGGSAPRGAKQQAALEILAGAPEGLPITTIRARGVSTDTVARLVKRGLLATYRVRVDRSPFAPERPAQPAIARALTPDQDRALSSLVGLAQPGAFRAALLHGVTGSGKTEIYLRLAQAVRAQGGKALVLVPEIALTPAIAAAFRGAFGERVAVQHSALSDGQRHDQWQRIRRGEMDVVVGTRSAVFAPLESLGVVVVDEEHDASYKQEESPRYNGRDVAVMRAKRERALVVLGSATPSLETYQNALLGRYERITLDRRILDRPLARVRVVDMREVYAQEGPDVILSAPLRGAIRARLDRREQVLILLNRRGFATSIFCRQCGGTIDCPNCSVSLTVHRGPGRVARGRCHYCHYSAAVPTTCPTCAAPYIEQAGFGTERVEEDVRLQFPGARVARLDRDAIRRQGEANRLLGRFREGALDVLVGTQMIAKGHDFPNVTLVGVVSADIGLGLADFRASERTFQLLTQVAGRAGRGEQPGEAVVQTLYPEHFSIQCARRQDYVAFFEQELAFRRAMRYPPLLSMINVIVRGRSFGEALAAASDLAARLRTRARGGGFEVLGPASAPLGKLRGEHRAQVFLKGGRRASMREALEEVVDDQPDWRRRISIDVDPLTVL